jgi:hypothetical protein
VLSGTGKFSIRGGGLQARQENVETAAAGDVLDPHLALVRLDNAAHDR